jgi:distribution and morphology protein 12
MSVDIDWEALTNGPTGARLAEDIRRFVHERFQQVALPHFVRAVAVHAFDFGRVPPVVEVVDVCDPLPDFYEDGREEDEDDGQEEGDDGDDGDDGGRQQRPPPLPRLRPPAQPHQHRQEPAAAEPPRQPPFRQPALAPVQSPTGLPPHLLPSYFHLPYAAGTTAALSGATTPLAAVAGGGHLHHPWPDAARREAAGGRRRSSAARRLRHRRASASVSSASASDPASRPPSGYLHDDAPRRRASRSAGSGGKPQSSSAPTDDDGAGEEEDEEDDEGDNDLQVVLRVRYAGDVSLSLSAELLLDFPTPGFVGIPLRLALTGFAFDGVAVIARVAGGRLHVCFLDAEDGALLLGGGAAAGAAADAEGAGRKAGGLFEEIRVESEIGQKDGGRQVLKNVGKVEKFVLDKVREIFEDEFVFPSFWTILV